MTGVNRFHVGQPVLRLTSGELAMNERYGSIARRRWLQSASAFGLSGFEFFGLGAKLQAALSTANAKAQIAITLDLEMSRNFPHREDLHWDYEKGNLDDAAKKYAVDAGQRVKARGGTIHYFCVGRVLEHPMGQLMCNDVVGEREIEKYISVAVSVRHLRPVPERVVEFLSEMHRRQQRHSLSVD